MALYEMMSCFGDSMTTGARCTIGYPEWLSKKMREATKRHWIVFNEAINGETALQLLRRMDQKNHVHKEASFVSVMIGTNDSKPQNRTSPDFYEELYRQIMERFLVRPHLTKICLTIPKLVDPICSPYDKGCHEFIDEYNKRIVKVAKEFDAILVDVSNLAPTLHRDGVHFNDKGSEEVANRMAAAILGR